MPVYCSFCIILLIFFLLLPNTQFSQLHKKDCDLGFEKNSLKSICLFKYMHTCRFVYKNSQSYYFVYIFLYFCLKFSFSVYIISVCGLFTYHCAFEVYLEAYAHSYTNVYVSAFIHRDQRSCVDVDYKLLYMSEYVELFKTMINSCYIFTHMHTHRYRYQ